MSYRTQEIEKPFVPNDECPECKEKELRHVDYPHDAGYLYDCEACEDHCHCGRDSGHPIKGLAACVYSECSDEDEK